MVCLRLATRAWLPPHLCAAMTLRRLKRTSRAFSVLKEQEECERDITAMDQATVSYEVPAWKPAAIPHEHYMRLALEEASKAAALGEVPVGAVLVSQTGEVLAAAHNQVETRSDPTAHAEMLCLRGGAAAAGGWRLLGTTLYVTLEPCPMCAGALLQARVGAVVYGARNHLLGADGSWVSLLPGGPAGEAGAGAGAEGAAAAEGGRAACGCSHSGHAAGGSGSGTAAERAGQAEAAVTLPAAPAGVPRHPFHPALTVVRGVLEAECGELMRAFFRARRRQAGGNSSGGSSDEGERWY